MARLLRPALQSPTGTADPGDLGAIGEVTAMSPRHVVAVAIPIMLAATVLVRSARQAGPTATPVFTPAEALQWTDLDPKGAPGEPYRDCRRRVGVTQAMSACA